MIRDQQDEILGYLAYIGSQKRSVDLVANFKGMPVHMAANIIRCSPLTGRVRLCLRHRQILPLGKTDTVLLQSDLFPMTAFAEIEDVYFSNQTLTLKNLRYVIGSMGNRKYARVQPKYPLRIEITTRDGDKLPGEIIDLSLNGVSVQLANSRVVLSDFLPLHSNVEVRFDLPGQNGTDRHHLDSQARVAYLQEDANAKTARLGLENLLGEHEQRVVRRYLFDRQTELLHDIQNLNNQWIGELIGQVSIASQQILDLEQPNPGPPDQQVIHPPE